MPNLISKFINWILNREKRVDKQKNSPITVIGDDVTIINITIDGDKD